MFGRIQTTDDNNNNNTLEWIVGPLQRWFLIRSNQIFCSTSVFSGVLHKSHLTDKKYIFSFNNLMEPLALLKSYTFVKTFLSTTCLQRRDPKIVAVVDRWSLYGGCRQLRFECSSKNFHNRDSSWCQFLKTSRVTKLGRFTNELDERGPSEHELSKEMKWFDYLHVRVLSKDIKWVLLDGNILVEKHIRGEWLNTK